MSYLKPQSPLELGQNYIYPLTTYDQIINADGSRGYLNSFLYTATLKFDNWSGSSPYTQTVSVSSTETNSQVTSTSVICSPAMFKQTSNLSTNNFLSYNLAIINNGNIAVGQGTITVTVFSKPNSDIQIYLFIQKGE